ncbi:MAG: NADH-quinone oxidoreductase subunit N [Flavobacteriales bacterium]
MKEILIISLLGIGVLVADILKLRKLIMPLILLGLTGMIVCSVLDWGRNEIPFQQYGGMLQFDHLALAFTMAISLISIFWFTLTADYFSGDQTRRTDLYALAVFSICGAVVLVSFSNMMTLFLGLEILSIPLYVLAASEKRNILSNEAGFKYFFLGSLASAIILFGIALVYGATGSFDVETIAARVAEIHSTSTLLKIGIVMILAGFAFKVSVAPFHLWAPDVYQGAPTAVTAFMATIVKTAAFAALYKLFSVSFAATDGDYTNIIAGMIALTLVVANLIAARQTNSKRLLAYSSISHAGFMMGIVMLANQIPGKYLLYYVLTYSIASLTAFGALHHVSSFQDGDESENAFKGLVKRNPMMAGAMTLALLSMAGIPPLCGFLAKYYVISGVLAHHSVWLVILMILTSVVSVYYYLKLIIAMFTPLENSGRIVVSKTNQFLYGFFAVLLIALFFGASLLELVEF